MGAVALAICVALAAPALAGTSTAAPPAGTPTTTPPARTSATAGASASTATSAAITSSLHPDRVDAKGSLTFTVKFTGGELGVPSPVHKSVMKFPAGLTLEIPSLHSCSTRQLLAHGPSGCPPQSKIGRGHALAEVYAGPQLITENVTVWAFIGPPANSGPTLELLGEGTSPVPAQVVVTGTVLPGHAPYGEELVIPVPPVPTLPSEADTSMVNLTLTMGTSGRHRPRNANTVIAPPKCPAGGFPFAAEFTFADGSTSTAFTTARCSR
jgi:hypothetical protein